MPAIALPSEIKRSSLWSLPTRHLLAARQNYNFPNNPSNSRSSLHPAAIFGIVAGVMLVIIITVWICWFRLVKKALTSREYGVLPSIRTAANNRNNNNPYNGYPYGPDGHPYGHGYGNHNYGADPTQFPPPAHHHYSHHQPPPAYDPGNSPHKPTDTGFGFGHTTDTSGHHDAGAGGATDLHSGGH